MIRDFSNPDHTRVRKDYERKSFANPFNEEERRRTFHTGKYLKILGAILVVYLFVYSDLLKITTVTISGTDMVPEAELRQVIDERLNNWRWFIVPERHYVWLNESRLRRDIESRYSLNKLELKKGWKTLNVTIEEKIAYIIIYNQDKFYFADANGTVIKEIGESEASHYWQRFPVLNVGQHEVAISSTITTSKMVTLLLDLDAKLREQKFPIQGYETRGVDTLVYVSRDGWRAFFSPERPAAESLDNLRLVLEQKVPDKNKLEYIDVRFGEKVFYK
ncbi:MAG: hypothetical protein KBB55_01140 [Candidatus Buchananbacteria bacterium]|nr:hypothetical protein [Candidatus Buchananbacteria bacterium]